MMSNAFLKRKIKKTDSVSQPVKKDEKQKLKSLPNSLVMRIMEDPNAENEADRLSQGVTSTTPEEIMREMGDRLGADFSDVQFHSDSLSMNRSTAMGARAWAQGSDVYFGKGGFDPKIAAHELVHTVQQGAVRGNVSESMPMGAVQMLKNNANNEDETEIKPNYALKDSDVQRMLTQIFATDMGRKVFNRMEKTLKEMITKGAGKNNPYTKEKGIEFLSLASGKDYSSKGILSTIMQKNIANKDVAMDVAYEYEQLIKLLSKRLGNYGLEDVAIKTALINQPPKYEHVNNDHKRAYETDMPGDEKDVKVFNPNNIPELTKIQKEIDDAADAKEAYRIFSVFSGNLSGKYIDEFKSNPDVTLFKKKLKHMTRVVYDYPELRNNIGNMTVMDPRAGALMESTGSVGGQDKIEFSYNANFDREGAEDERATFLSKDLHDKRFNAPNYDYAGTHEMGHGLASLLIDQKDRVKGIKEQNYGVNENDILKTVIENTDVLTDKQKLKIRYFDQDTKVRGKIPVKRGQIDTERSKLFEAEKTSRYGRRAPVELFAESFHDVYANGKNAKRMSIEIVKEYEKRQRQLTEKKFKKNAKRGFFRRIMDFFKF